MIASSKSGLHSTLGDIQVTVTLDYANNCASPGFRTCEYDVILGQQHI